VESKEGFLRGKERLRGVKRGKEGLRGDERSNKKLIYNITRLSEKGKPGDFLLILKPRTYQMQMSCTMM
jgi:hypothetical protein